MPNVITNFGFVKKSGDAMTGNLDMQANKIRLGVGTKGCLIYGDVGSPRMDYRNPGDTLDAMFDCYGLSCNGGSITLVGAKTVDGVDVSEIGKPAGGLYLVSDQLDIAHQVQTVVELDTILANFGDGVEDTDLHKITPGVAGFYAIIGQVTYANLVVDKKYNARLTKNGGTVIADGADHASLNINLPVPVCIIAYLSASDYVQLEAYHNAGVGTIDIYAGDAETFLTLERLR